MTAQLFKILGPDRTPCFGGRGQWPGKGEWHSVPPPLVPCKHGLHVCRVADLPYWVRVGAIVWDVDVDGACLSEPDKVVVERARLVYRLGVMSRDVLASWALDCVEHVAHLAGSSRQVCREAIRVARLGCLGLASGHEIARVAHAAYVAYTAERSDTLDASAASEAIYAAYVVAAQFVPGEAAQFIPGEAALDAALDAALAAARAAAARAAARAAAQFVPGEAARAAARAEREWQGRRLLDLLEKVQT